MRRVQSAKTILLLSLLAAALLAQNKRAQPPPKPPDPFLTSSIPLKLEAVTAFLEKIKDGTLPNDKRLIEAIRNRHVDFPLTPETETLLKTSGASEQLLETVRKVAPPPPPDPTGSINIKCSPAECDVFIKGALLGSTVGGQLTAKSLPVGRTVVELNKAGYIGSEQTVAIVADRTESLESRLEPDNNTKTGFGKQLLTAMLQRVGIAEGKTIPDTFYGTGSATVRSVDGKNTEWEFLETCAPGQTVVFELHAAKTNLELRCAADKCVFKAAKSKSTGVEDVGAILRALLKYQFPAMLGRIQSDRLSPTAPSADLAAAGEQHFRLEGPDETYEIVLGADLLPLRITSSTKGAAKETSVSYSHFVKLGEVQYPLETEIKLPDAEQHGIQVKLTQLTPGVKPKEKRLLKFPK